MTPCLVAIALLAAPPAPKPIAEPAPPAEFKRLQPRHVTASSVLRDSYNRFEQNYLPLYVADDSAATAWVEGAPGQGVGESLLWQGPKLEKAKELKLFIRNGLQASKKLFDANSRIKKLKIEPLLIATDGVGFKPAGAPLEVDLQSVQGWQEFAVPVTPAVSGVRLTIISTYKGSVYEDTCLSDLRVYVSGEDPYNAAVETKALDEIRAFIASREQLKPQLASTYAGKKLADGKGECTDTDSCLAAFDGIAAAAPAIARAKKALARAGEVSDYTPKGWGFINDLKGKPASALASIFSTLYLSNGMAAPNDLFDRRSLRLEPVARPKLPTRRRDSDSPSQEEEAFYGQDMVLGAPASPAAVMVREAQVIDGRSSTSVDEGTRWIVTYDGDLADAVIDLNHSTLYLIQWSTGDGSPKLESIITLDLNHVPSAYQWAVKAS